MVHAVNLKLCCVGERWQRDHSTAKMRCARPEVRFLAVEESSRSERGAGGVSGGARGARKAAEAALDTCLGAREAASY